MYYDDDGTYTDETSEILASLSPEARKILCKQIVELLIRFPDPTRHELTLGIYMADLATVEPKLLATTIARLKSTCNKLPTIADIMQEIERQNSKLIKERETKDKVLTAKCPFCDSVGFRYYLLQSCNKTATRKCTHKPEIENQPKYSCALPVMAKNVDNQEQIPFDPNAFFKGVGRSFPR